MQVKEAESTLGDSVGGNRSTLSSPGSVEGKGKILTGPLKERGEGKEGALQDHKFYLLWDGRN